MISSAKQMGTGFETAACRAEGSRQTADSSRRDKRLRSVHRDRNNRTLHTQESQNVANVAELAHLGGHCKAETANSCFHYRFIGSQIYSTAQSAREWSLCCINLSEISNGPPLNHDTKS